MSKPRVLFTRILPAKVMDEADKLFALTIRDSAIPMTEKEAIQSLEEYDAVVPTLGDDFNADVFPQVNNLRCKILANFGAGYNHIEVSAAKDSGVTITNTPGAVTDATADIALSLILMTARRTVEGDRIVRTNQWTGWKPTEMLGTHVTGQTLGIIGMGRIGKAIAKRCQAGFDMKVIFFNRSRVADPGVEATQLDSAEEVVAKANFVVVAVRSGPESYHIIDRSLLSAMRKDGIFINISRGDVVDEQALIEALSTNQIAGAGLDVYEFEPEVPDELKAMENVVLLPHLGTSVLAVREDMGMMVIDNLKAYFTDGNPPNKVV
ncbi:MAG: D-glycerate dehydrogenase [Rhodobacteraceae bacterium]|nr:D-glycerate dehydrogenase [Paracoccaceae bacterium]MCY4249993.1 D-glycerate dehydrogenase [Paracoccaceae bacterium]